jgi:GNAT superfamily N-acetyltransferase
MQEAREAEGRELNEDTVRRGVLAAFGERPASRYWVAEGPGGAIVAIISTTNEWSDFRAGEYWWVQSLFIRPEYRRSGLLELLLDHLADEARRRGALELRLYVHQGNERAVRAYRRSGFHAVPYTIMARTLD